MNPSAPNSHEPWARAILEQNRRWLLAYFIAATGDAHRAEDLVQDVFAAALKDADRFDPAKSFGAWLRGIARNVLLMNFRKSKRRTLSLDGSMLDLLDQAAAQSESAHAVPGYSELRHQVLRECLKTLTDRGRKVLGLKYGDGRLSREIAERTGMEADAVDMLLSRARKSLQECISRKMASVTRG